MSARNGRFGLGCALALSVSGAARADGEGLRHAATLHADEAGRKLRGPAGIACTEDGKLVVADTGNGRLLTLAFKGGKFTPAAEVKVAQLGSPTRVQIDSRGDVLSLDSRGRRIARVGLSGEFRGFLEPTGVPGRDLMPMAFKLDGQDRLIVLDGAEARVVVLEPGGRFKRALPLPAGTFLDVAVDGRGAIYALEVLKKAVWVSRDGLGPFAQLSKRLGDYASFPTYLAVTARGLIAVVDGHGNGLVVLGPDGSFLRRQLSMGWKDGELYYPAQICLDGAGDLFVADRSNQRVQVFTPTR